VSRNSVSWDFIAHDKSASSTLDKISGKAHHLGKTIGLAIGGLAATGVAALGVAMVKGIKDATDYQTLGLKTAAVLKSTGNVAHLSAKGIREYAARLEDMSGVDENLIINAENVLATFTKVRNETGKGNDVFNRATAAALDMSVALGMDLQSATMKVGKALQDPVKGVTALRKAGVMLTEQQEKQIKTLIANGDQMGAQKIVLGELTKEFGGAAKAAGHGLAGSVARLKDAFGDAFRDIAMKALPVLTDLVEGLADKLPKAIAKVTPLFRAIGNGLKDFYAGLSGHGPIDGFSGSLNTLGLGLRALGLAFKDGDVTSNGFVGAMERAGVGARNLSDAVGAVSDFVTGELIPAFRDAFKRVMPLFQQGMDNLRAAFGNSGEAGGKLKKIFTDVWAFVKRYLIPVIAWLAGTYFVSLTAQIRVVAAVFTKVLLPVLSIVVKTLIAIVSGAVSVIKWLGSLGGKIVSVFSSAGKWLYDAGKDVIFGFWDGLKAVWSSVTDWVSGIGSWIKDHKGPISLDRKLLVPAGKAIMGGFLSGLKSGAGPAWSFVTSVGGKTKEMMAKALGWIPGAGWLSDLIHSGGGSGGNASNMALGQALAAQRGWTGAQWSALQALWMGESGWNNNAQNPTSTAYGIAQFLDSTWGAVGFHKSSNPATQILAGLKYIQQSYGSPLNALRAWSARSPHWYDRGGLLQPGYTLAYNGTGRAEGIFTAEQMSALGGPGQVNVRVFIGDTELRGVVRTEVDGGLARAARAAGSRRSAS
jgi:hypothetical protein